MQKFDVAVVGGGPAGAMASMLLTSKEASVVLLDEEPQHKKPCGGALTPRVITKLGSFGISIDDIVSQSRSLVVHSRSSDVEFELVRPIYLTRRASFISRLIERTEEFGTEIIYSRVVDVNVSRDQVTLNTKDGARITSEYLIGADGVNSPVATKTGLRDRWAPDQVALSLVKEVEVEEGFIADRFGDDRPIHVFLMFGNVHGYGWVFPKRGYINFGIAGTLSKLKSLNKIFLCFTDTLKSLNLLPGNIQAKGFSAALIPWHGPTMHTYGHRVILCGDAAGFVNPISGEGIYFALCSGELAAEAINTAMRRKEGYASLSSYENAWKRAFEEELAKSLTFRPLLFGNQTLTDFLIKMMQGDIGIKRIGTDMLSAWVDGRDASFQTYMRFAARAPLSLLKVFI